MNTRNITPTERMQQDFRAVRAYYDSKGIEVSTIRKLNGRYRVENGNHGWYATFVTDDEGRIIGDTQTIL